MLKLAPRLTLHVHGVGQAEAAHEGACRAHRVARWSCTLRQPRTAPAAPSAAWPSGRDVQTPCPRCEAGQAGAHHSSCRQEGPALTRRSLTMRALDAQVALLLAALPVLALALAGDGEHAIRGDLRRAGQSKAACQISRRCRHMHAEPMCERGASTRASKYNA